MVSSSPWLLSRLFLLLLPPTYIYRLSAANDLLLSCCCSILYFGDGVPSTPTRARPNTERFCARKSFPLSQSLSAPSIRPFVWRFLRHSGLSSVRQTVGYPSIRAFIHSFIYMSGRFFTYAVTHLFHPVRISHQILSPRLQPWFATAASSEEKPHALHFEYQRSTSLDAAGSEDRAGSAF